MTRLGYLLATTAAAELFCSLFATVALTAPHPRLIWNASASVPIGLYRVTPADKPEVGEMVVIAPPRDLARYLDERHYLPVGVPLLKHVAATQGMTVCRYGARITIAGQRVATALPRDSHGRILPVWRGCRRVGTHELFLLNAAPDSMDGRYFGVISDAGLLGVASPLFPRETAKAALTWHGLGSGNASRRPAPEVRHD